MPKRPELLGPREVCRALGVSKMTLSRWRRAGVFPRPIVELEIGPVWRAADVRRWAQSRSETSEK